MESNKIPTSLLKPHPKNAELFPERLPDNLWDELVADIKENGIINPLVVTPDYTVLAGHLRLEAAKEAGLTHVPVIIKDVDPNSDEAISLLIRDNLLRRQLNDMQVARLIKKLKEVYNIKKGRRQKEENGENAKIKHEKISHFLALSERRIQQLDKLNDLIPELQELVSSGKLNSTAAVELAFLSPETQRELYSALGEKLAELKYTEVKELRRRIESEIRSEAEKQINELKRKVDELTRQQKELQMLHEQRESELTKAIADLQESLSSRVPSDDVARLQEEIRKKEQELADVQNTLAAKEAEYKAEIESLKEKLEKLESEKSQPEIIEKVVEKVVPDPVQQERIEELEAQIAVLREAMNGVNAEAIAEEIKRLQAEKKVLEREVNRLRSPSLFTSRMRKLMLMLEKEEIELAELANQVDISKLYFMEAQKSTTPD